MSSVYTEKQLALMRLWQTDQLKRINILEGSVSSGKTWVSLVLWAFWVKTMPADEDCLYLMSARSLTTLKRNCLVVLEALVGRANFSFSISAKEGRLFGRRILLEGANDAQAEAKIRGITLQGAYADEATKLPKDFFAMLLSRLRKAGAKLFCTTNPDSPSHWLKTDYIDRIDELDLLDVKFTIDDNTTLTAEYVENIKKEYTGVFYDRFISGNWVLAEGIIYPMYKDALGDPPDGSEAGDYRLSVDYGTLNAFAALLWEKHGDTWCCTREYYYSGRDNQMTKTDEEYGKAVDDFIRDIMEPREMAAKKDYYLFQKMKVIIDPSAASFIALLRKRKWYTIIKADNAILDGIRETATCMQNGKIRISSKCKNLIKELEGYVWDGSSQEDKPVKVNDHAADAMRYFCKTMNLAVKRRA